MASKKKVAKKKAVKKKASRVKSPPKRKYANEISVFRGPSGGFEQIFRPPPLHLVDEDVGVSFEKGTITIVANITIDKDGSRHSDVMVRISESALRNLVVDYFACSEHDNE